MLIRLSRTKRKTPKKYSRPSSRRVHRKYKVQMTFLVSVSIKLRIPTFFLPFRLFKLYVFINIYIYLKTFKRKADTFLN